MITLIPDFSDEARPLELDETLNLARVFMANHQLFTVASITAQPHWREQLHEVGLFDNPRWNVFDVIQDVTEADGLPLTLNQLGLGSGMNVTYLPDHASFYQGMQMVATANLTETGFVDTVAFAPEDGVTQIDQYDDRGFRTWRTWQRGDDVMRRSWFTPAGRLVMTQQNDGSIEIAASQRGRFAQAHYPDMHTLVAEALNRAIATGVLAQPLIGTASSDLARLRSQLHAASSVKLLAAADTPRLQVLRTQIAHFAPTDEIIVPTKVDQQRVEALEKQLQLAATPHVRYVPTYATTLSLGISNELSAQIIAWHVGDLNQDRLRADYKALLTQLQQHDDRSLQVVVDDAAQRDWLMGQTAEWAQTALHVDMTSDDFKRATEYRQAVANHTLMIDMAQAMQPLVASSQWPTLMAALDFLDRVQIHAGMNQEEWQYLLHTARVLIDTGSRPLLALQAAAVSAGVPQINLTSSDLVIPNGNGRVVADKGELTTAITYYFSKLAHWNEALVVNADLIEKYAAANIMAAWQEVIGDGTTTR